MTTTMGWFILTGIGVLAVTTGVAAGLARASASLRHLVWASGLLAALAVACFELSGIEVAVPLPGGWALPALSEGNSPHSAPTGEHATDGVAQVRMADGHVAASGSLGGDRHSGERPRIAVADRAGAVTLRPANPPTSATEPGPSEPTSERASRNVLPASAVVSSALPALVWGLGAIALLGCTFLGHVRAWRMTVRGGTRPAPSAARRFASICVELGIRRPVRLLVTPDLDVPATWGLMRPTVMLPTHYETWSSETLERVLLHELAHVRRGDCRTFLVGEVARALHWMNPLAWLALRRLRAEAERACDDVVLARGEAASSYAADLVGFVRRVKLGGPLPEPVLTISDVSGLGRRVQAILDPHQARGSVSRRTVLATATLALVLSFASTAVVPVASAQERPEASHGPSVTVRVEPAPEPRRRAVVLGEGSRVRPVEPTMEPKGGAGPAAPEPRAALSLSGEVVVEPVDEPRPTIATAWRHLGDLSIRWAAPVPSVAPAQSLELCVFRGDGSRSSSTNVDEDVVSIRWETDDCRVDIDMRGEIDFLPDDSGIASMGRGARFEVEEREGRAQRRARFEGTAQGLERKYWVDGSEVAWSEEADRWIADVLPEIFRHTTINAEARVRRMLDEGGPDRVFREVASIRSDHVSRRYLELLIENGSLSEADYVRVIEHAGALDSDHSAGELLLTVVETAGLRDAFQEPLLRAATGIESDHQKGRVLEALLAADLSPRQLDAVVAATRSIESDHTLSEILSDIARRGRLDVMDRQSFLEAMASIESDHSTGVVLDAFLDAGPLEDDDLDRVLALTEGIDSDHQRSEILQRVAREYPLDGAQADAYLQSASRIESDHEMAVTAIAILERRDIDGDQLDLVLRMTRSIDSDHQRATVLRAIMDGRDLDAEAVAGVLRAASDMDSDSNLAETLSFLAEDERLDDAGVRAVLETAASIDSDHQLASVMTELASRYPIEGPTRTLYQELADGMSRHQRDQVLAALVR